MGLEGFNAFVARNSSRISLDPARSFHGRHAQLVDAGLGPIGLHCENGNSPVWPELCWFYCEKAARLGSQTTLCEGRTVWARLSPETRSLFQSNDIAYSRRVDEPRWKTYVQHALGKTSVDDVRFADLERVTAGTRSRTILNDDGSIHYSVQVPAVRAGAFSSEPGFANSILGPSNNYEAPVIAFADGSPIPDHVMEEIRRVTEEVTDEIDWRDGDLLLIDNMRVMHGRRAILDPDRIIYNALSFI